MLANRGFEKMAKESRNWTCPHCNRPQTLTSGQDYSGTLYLSLAETRFGPTGLLAAAKACANPECRELTLDVELTTGNIIGDYGATRYEPNSTVATFRLRPESSAKPQPEYIPPAIRQDYFEACRIRDLSAKASATLARRCLQGMIRDFCSIAKATLFEEIKELKASLERGAAPKGVTHESVEAIDHVRSIGNIGAHMEKDVNLIIDIDPGEAQALVELIEMLFTEWYVARKGRDDRLAAIARIGAEKRGAIPKPQADAKPK
jgi:hypothetical protein